MKKYVLITGVNRGIGFETAKLFIEKGWYVIGVDQKTMNKELVGIGRFIKIDISESYAPTRIINSIKLKETRLDAIVNNAAVQICKPINKISSIDWDITIAANVKFPYFLSIYAQKMLKRCKGSIVNVCSVHAFATSKKISAYAISKGALLALTRALAIEFASDNIRVNAVVPGAINTKMLLNGLKRNSINNNMINLLSQLKARHPMSRIGEPKEIAQAILFLTNNECSSFITGQSLVVDGGALAKLCTE